MPATMERNTIPAPPNPALTGTQGGASANLARDSFAWKGAGQARGHDCPLPERALAHARG